jgi:vancomycin resistance protein YoaR
MVETVTSPVPRPSLPERLGRRLRSLAKTLSKRQLVGAGIALVALLALAPALREAFADSSKVAGGVHVAGLDVSRHERGALESALGARARELEKRSLPLKISEREFSLDPAAIGFRIDVRETVARVLSVGRRGHVFGRIAGIYARFVAPEEVELASSVGAEEISKLLARWEETAIADRAFGGGIKIVGSTVEALAPRGGRTLDRAAAERTIRRSLHAPEPTVLELPVVSVPAPLPRNAADAPAREARALVSAPITLISNDPEARIVLSPERLGPVLYTTARPPKLVLGFSTEGLEKLFEEARKSIEADAVDAKVLIDDAVRPEKISVVPSRAGVRIEFAKIADALTLAAARPDRTAPLPILHEPKPALATEEAERLGIKGLVSSFTTRHPCCEKRVANIHRIADIMNGKVVRPGETVSVNALVGPRTLKTGFVPAPTIEEGEIVDSIGGGISQFATTLFNALFHGGYEIVERQPHTYWFPRYPMGHEATLSWPKPDIIFKNDTAAGMVFKTSYTGTSVTVKIYGDNGGRKVRAEVSGRQNVIEPSVEILPNARVPPDEETIKEPGSVGWSVIVSRFLTFPDGTTREDRRRVTYKPRPKRVEVHPCRIPKGEKGYTGERCPEPEDVEVLPEPEPPPP